MKKLLLATLLSIICSGLFAQWYSQTSGTYQNLRSVYFTDSLNGWIVGSSGVMLHTVNGGTNWDIQISSTDETLTYVFFTDSIHGWIAGYIPQGYISYGILYRTLDGGNSWERFGFGWDYNTVDEEIYFIYSINGWTSKYRHTTDGGENWVTQFTGHTNTIGGVYFIDSLKGWVAGSWWVGGTGYVHSLIFHTNDGGNTWESQFDGAGSYLKSVYFTDNLNGWVAGGRPIISEIILKTTDGGNNWNTSYYNNYGCLNSIYFADAFNGLAVGHEGSILYTSNGGNTWETEPSGTTNDLQSVYFSENGYAWVVGYGGTILHADYSQIVGSHESEAKNIQSNVRYYPNPFTTSTTLSYELQNPEKVSLSIYNQMGKQVYQTQENQVKGKQQLTWSADGFADGIYYYRLQVGDAIANGKMVKVR